MSFQFSTPKSASGFTLPTPTTTSVTTTSTMQFTSGSGDNPVTTTNKATNLFGSSTPSSLGTGFSLGGSAGKPSTTPTSSFSYGLTPTSASTGFNIESTQSNTPSSLAQFGLGSTLSSAPTTTISATSAPSLNFSAPSSSTTGGFSLSTPSVTASTSTGFLLGSSVGTQKSGAAPMTSVPSLNFSFSAASTASATITNPTTTTNVSSTPHSTTTLISTQSALPISGTLTFAQLEDAINKWTIDLEDQGKIFANQAKELNAWDHILIANGEKILTLNSGIERIKQQQTQLDQELDFIVAQQKELEDLIVPLEKELSDVPIHDQDRNQIYHLAEDLDAQLKQMSDDLKEVVEHLNETSKTHDLHDPVTQISKILNAHMNSLQWIDRNTTEVDKYLDEISKVQDLNRPHNSFREY